MNSTTPRTINPGDDGGGNRIRTLLDAAITAICPFGSRPLICPNSNKSARMVASH
jgi:hypothetical protein